MNNVQLLGGFLVLLPFLILFLYICVEEGVRVAVTIYSVASAIIIFFTFIAFALYLLSEGQFPWQ